MSMLQIRTSHQDRQTRLALAGRFDFNSHRLFRDTCEKALNDAEIRGIEIDMGGVIYLDSSALGMLLLLREKAGNANKALALSNCHDVVQQVLEVANFGNLFSIR
jgi:HptB-dependent secretion and biofilm anti anti-sigma factor